MKSFREYVNEKQDVAKTIYKQLGGNKFKVMVGVISATDTGDGLIVKFKAVQTKNKSNAVEIKLNDKDLYDVRFLSILGMKVKEKGEFKDVYADQLQSLFKEETGLDTHL